MTTDINSLKVDELKKLCKERGLVSTGKKKAELVQLISEHDKQRARKETTAPDVAPKTVKPVETETQADPPQAAVETVKQVKPALEKTAEVSEAERLKLRAAKFGVEYTPLEDDKRKARADRFCTYNADLEAEKQAKRNLRFVGENQEVDEDSKRRKRMDRFGTGAATNGGSVPPMVTSDMSLEDKKAARAARFASSVTVRPTGSGATATKSATLNEDEEQKKRRLERFGICAMTDDDKKKNRAMRFGIAS